MHKHIPNIVSRLIDKRLKHSPHSNKVHRYYEVPGHFHSAAIISKNGKILSIGHNVIRTVQSRTIPQHAEHMAFDRLINKLDRNDFKRKLSVNVLVIRTNGGDSSPCGNCVSRMDAYSKHFTIRNIYYTHSEEMTGIRKEKFTSLLQNENQHISSYYRQKLKETNCHNCSDIECSDHHDEQDEEDGIQDDNDDAEKNLLY